MTQSGTNDRDERADRVAALIAQSQAEVTFDRIARPEEFKDLRRKLWDLAVDLVPPSHHQQLQEAFVDGFDRLLDALVADGRRLEVAAVRLRKLELENLQLRAQHLKFEMRLLAFEKGGNLDPADPDAVHLGEQLFEVLDQVRRFTS